MGKQPITKKEAEKEVRVIEEVTKDSLLNIALDTIKINKQALIFVSSRQSAEKTAEDIAKKIKEKLLPELAGKVLNILPRPTKQCERLSRCVEKGVAFHHAGLTAEQKELVEENFRSGRIKIICCTPTLAYGVDLPAFRAIIRDLYRYGVWGMQFIPVLDFQQMIGRAGRPGKEDFGEAIAIAKTKRDASIIIEKFFNGKPENIYSKLAVEPVFRTYLLSLIAANFCTSKKEINDFFSRTFYAHQYRDLEKLSFIIDKMLHLLEDWRFIVSDENDFKPADNLDTTYTATLLGKRVAQLYLDPYTAHFLVESLRKIPLKRTNPFSFLHLISCCLEMRPWLKARNNEIDSINEKIIKMHDSLLAEEPLIYEQAHEYFIDQFKTAMFFEEWINEKDEEYLLENYNIRPGEIKTKLEIADWLLYSLEEISRIMQMPSLIKELLKLRLRVKHGAKEELLPLLRLKNIGRARARKLYENRLRTIDDLKNIDVSSLKQIIGEKIAENIKEQLGEEIEEVLPGRRKGQLGLGRFDD